MANLTKPSTLESAPKALKLITGEADITQGIKSAEGRGKSLQKDWHILACSIIAHIEAHRANGVNANLANALVASLPNGVRKNALLDWFCAHGAVEFNDETRKLMFSKTQKTLQLQAEAKPFWEFKPEPAYHAFDLDKAISDLLKRAEKHAEAKDNRDTIDMERLAKLKALAPVAKA